MDRQVRLFQQHAFGIQRLELGQLRQVGDLVLALIGGGVPRCQGIKQEIDFYGFRIGNGVSNAGQKIEAVQQNGASFLEGF